MNVVVGANNAGKSTLVESLRVLSLVANKYRGLTYARPPEWTELPARSLGVSPALHDIDLRGGSVFHRYGDPPACISAAFSGGARVEVYIGPDDSVFGLIFDATGTLINSRSRAKDTEIPSIAILPQIGPLLDREAVLSEEHVVRSIGTNLASRHFRNQLHWLNKPYYRAFVQQAERSWPNLHIESLNIDGVGSDSELTLHVRDTNFVAEIGWMGHGLQMWLQTMWFLARSEGAGTVILDEPDVYMHADLQRRLIRLLRSRSGQTVIATHSVEIMSEVDPDAILIVDKVRRRSAFASSLPAVQSTIDRLGGVHNIHLARLWGTRRCLHVEGKDVAFLKAFQDRLYPQSDAPFDLLPRLPIGGWTGWKYAVGSSMTLKNAAGEAIAAYCILDSDYQTDEEIDERYAEAVQHNVRLHVWRMKEIENYLLSTTALARVITQGMKGRTEGPTPFEIGAKLDEIANELRDSVFDALSHALLSRNRAGGVAGANQHARERIEQAWANPEGRLSIVSGKLMLTKLSEWSKATYGVSFGAPRVARELRADEISNELKSVVRAIERIEVFPRTISRSTRG